MSSPQPPDGGQQGSDPTANRMDPQDPNQAGGDATQVVRPVQPQAQQGQQPPSDSTQVVPPSMQPPQPMYQQPGLDQTSGAEATAMVPPSMQPPQPMYQQPGTQSQPGGFPAAGQPGTPGGGFPGQPGTPGGGFPAPQAQGGFPAPPPIGGPGQPAPAAGQGNQGLAKTTAILALVFGGLGVLFGIIGFIGLAWASSAASEYGVEIGAPMGLLYALAGLGLVCSIAWIVGGVLLQKRNAVGPLIVGGVAVVSALQGLVGVIMYPTASGVFGILFGLTLAVLAFLPGTREWAAGSGAPAPAATGGFGPPPGQQGGFGQPQGGFGQQPPQQFGQQPQQFGQQPGQPPQQFGQPGQPPQQW